MTKIRVLQIGVGAIGCQILRDLYQKDSVELIGVVDEDPQKLGMDVGVLLGFEKLKMSVKEGLHKFQWNKIQKPDIAILTTSSSLEGIKPILMALLDLKIPVLSTCEELTYPWKTQPALAQAIDQKAKENGVAVLATGVNPGFLMDFLPLVMTGVCKEVEKIQVERIQDAQFRRLPFQKKIGTGLSREAFFKRVKEGALRHIGLTESMHLVASKLGWELDRTEDVVEPVVATKQVFSGDLFIGKGDILGMNQTGVGYINNQEVIRLFFRATIGEPNPRDRVLITGTPNLELEVKEGLNGDIATCSLIVNAIPVVCQARPGLRTMADIEPIGCYQ